VVGLMSAKGQTTMGTDQDDRIVIPIGTYWRRVAGNRDVSYMQISARDGIDTQRLTERIAGILRDRRNIRTGEDDDFHVRDMKEIANTLAGATRVLTVLLGAIAAVSLIVGGIGIMNIMLVSVTERTREIGIRQAIGALEQDVLLQFLVEAVVLSSLGGVVGILISIIASYIMALVLNSAFFYDITIAFVAFLFSAAVGVIFGYLPARKAARMDPIEALRRE
ncbi:MAG: FtsX-like permease family protein, partial [Leptospiraceae bacterium]|nr:FtsX-like permease family protein [Leptospiraceae bacterium]